MTEDAAKAHAAYRGVLDLATSANDIAVMRDTTATLSRATPSTWASRMNNAHISGRLARCACLEEAGSVKARPLRRAARAALSWPREAVELLARRLT